MSLSYVKINTYLFSESLKSSKTNKTFNLVTEMWGVKQ